MSALRTNPADIIAAGLITVAVYEVASSTIAKGLKKGYARTAEIAEKIKKDEYKEKIKLAGLDKESAMLYFIVKRHTGKEGLFIRKMIAYIELLLFGGLAFLLYKETHRVLDINNIKILLTAFAGWMAIKIFGNYAQWSGTIFGRSTYYIFLIGSVFNAFIAITIGFLLSFFFFAQ